MPVVIVYGLPAKVQDTPPLEALVMTGIPEAIASVPELGLTPRQVTTFAPQDLLSAGLGEEVIVFIEGLFRKPERTPEARQQMADAVRDTVQAFVESHVPECSLVEVIPRSQNPDDGFSQWRRE